MLLRLLPSLLALLLALRASAWPLRRDLLTAPSSSAGVLKEERHDRTLQEDYSSAARSELFGTYSDKGFTGQQHDSYLALSSHSQPWHNIEVAEGPGEGYV
ncbi:uncharacterized protein BT62DRAFT_937862 [Guyanagaster necrorhizus]|uniref:Uncharacterized protein n=1 Tax=Guyanagaster necrorhizus TaxID=856835 RepID=A0A9P7VHE9_9AGAR|nr:uncharacterized protein BT62DRAFT_937862 [Guyanagaster necrorhizus MCA 3950]KAG7440605.1 hypothetical protein BT62DRAFT_937862 [Guyanagaster necrorhizus MCA 3950]